MGFIFAFEFLFFLILGITNTWSPAFHGSGLPAFRSRAMTRIWWLMVFQRESLLRLSLIRLSCFRTALEFLRLSIKRVSLYLKIVPSLVCGMHKYWNALNPWFVVGGIEYEELILLISFIGFDSLLRSIVEINKTIPRRYGFKVISILIYRRFSITILFPFHDVPNF